MGKKYIIELEDKPFHKEDGDFLYRVKGFNSLVFDMTGIGMLTPYAAPDLERVRKEAYQKGYETGYEDGYNEPGKNQQEAYQRGLSDAWEAARKVSHCALWDDYRTDTGKLSVYTGDVLDYYTAAEAVEKLKAYEQEKEEQIQVGDEVITASGKAVVTGVGPVHFEYFNEGGSGFDKVKDVKKTGRHFPEIAAVLKKMREDGNQNRIQETMSDDY